jgi:predicted kinase
MIIIVFGLPGVGKSYFAKALAKYLEGDYYGTDEMRRNMKKVPDYTKEKKLEVYNELIKKISSGDPIVFDGTFSLKQVRNDFVSKANRLNQSVFFIEIICDEDVIKNRLQKKRIDSDADFEVYQKMKIEFEAMEEPHLFLRSDIFSLNEMLESAKQYIYK